jgi:hypothetical protein
MNPNPNKEPCAKKKKTNNDLYLDMEYLVGPACCNNVLKSNCLISHEALKDQLLVGHWIWKIRGPGTSGITYFA